MLYKELENLLSTYELGDVLSALEAVVRDDAALPRTAEALTNVRSVYEFETIVDSSDEQEAIERDRDVEADAEESDYISIPCSKCGKPTSFDPTYGDLCYRCIRADNE